VGSSSRPSAYGRALHRFDKTGVPGGSSGGSAALVAAGAVPAALGSETGGSVRQPASLCGVVGIKPTYGRVSRYGLVAFGSSLDQIGVLGRSVHDAARVLSVISGRDPKDSTCEDRDPLRLPNVPESLQGFVIGVPKEYFPADLDPAVRRACDRAVRLLRGLGAAVREGAVAHTGYAVPTYYILAPAEASSNLARYDGARYGPRFDGSADVRALYRTTRGEGVGPEVRRRILLGTYVLSSGYYDAYYRKAQQMRALIAQDVRHPGGGHRTRDARAAADGVQNVLRLLGGVRCAPQHECLPRVPGPPGGAPDAERAGAAARGACGTGAGMHGAPPQRVRAQELLLSRPAQGLPDFAVRAAARDRRVAVVPVAGPGDRHGHDSAAPRGGGRREVAARPLSEANGHRLEPLWGAPHRDRDGTRLPLSPRGARLPPHAEAGARVCRGLRLRYGKGQLARRCKRVGAPGGAAGVGNEDRSQEHQLVRVRREGADGGARSADRAARSRGPGGAADAVVRREDERCAPAARQGREPRLPLLPRSGPAARRAARGVHRGAAGAPARAAGDEARALRREVRAQRDRRSRAHGRSRRRGLLRGRGPRRCGIQGGGQLGDDGSARGREGSWRRAARAAGSPGQPDRPGAGRDLEQPGGEPRLP